MLVGRENDNFAVRPEVRCDFTSDTARPAFNDSRRNDQLLFGSDLEVLSDLVGQHSLGGANE